MTKIKTLVKYSFGKIAGVEDKDIMHAVRKACIISFDIFDTLVKRNIPMPGSVHELVRREFMKQTGIDVHKYVKYRLDAEIKARRYSCKEEISLDDIFNYLEEMPEEHKSMLKELEEQIEIAVCTPNLRMKAIYENVLRDGKRVIITSDMYLREEIIRKILHKCGYDNYEKLYLSSSCGLSKATGNLFDVVKKDYSAFHGKILHIGDNLRGDYVIPKSKNVKPLLIDGNPDWLKFWKRKNNKVENQFLYQQLYSFLNNHISVINSDANSIGYEVLGPMLLGYCRWLNEKIENDKIEKLFFLSREGKILQDAFQILYPQNKIQQHYLYVSRQSLVVPLLADARSFDEMFDLIKTLAHLPQLKTIPVICNLNKEDFDSELKHIGLDVETAIHEISEEKKEEVYHIIKKMGDSLFKQQKIYIENYLKTNDFVGNIGIIDIGWSGTMQHALQMYVSESDTILHGYYIGVRNIEAAGCYTGLQRKGYLFEPGYDENYDFMTRFTTEIIEMLFLNCSGSVLGYVRKDGRTVPVLAEPEYAESENKFVKSMQTSALDFLNSIEKDSIFNNIAIIPTDIIMSIYSCFAVQPSLSTIKMFAGFQVLNGSVRKILPEHGILYYIGHFHELKRDFSISSSKIFFLKKLFRIKFPYFQFLKLLFIRWNSEVKWMKNKDKAK